MYPGFAYLPHDDDYETAHADMNLALLSSVFDFNMCPYCYIIAWHEFSLLTKIAAELPVQRIEADHDHGVYALFLS
jgi:hypothetical protein